MLYLFREQGDIGVLQKPRRCEQRLYKGLGSRLDLKYAVCGRWVLRLEQSDGNVVNRNSAGRETVQFSIMSVSVKNEIGAVPVDDLG
jgi:hypothetical protein